MRVCCMFLFFFFNDTAPTAIYTLSLHDALPICEISENSILTIKSAFESKPPIRITVDGEEDLLVIPVCLYAPENCIVMYGQPNEGLVIVHINQEIKDKVQKIVNVMN